MVKEKINNNMVLIAIVAIVAIIGIVVVFVGNGSIKSNVSGRAFEAKSMIEDYPESMQDALGDCFACRGCPSPDCDNCEFCPEDDHSLVIV